MVLQVAEKIASHNSARRYVSDMLMNSVVFSLFSLNLGDV